MIAIILIPFFGLMHHARREGGGVVSDLSEMLEWMYLRCVVEVWAYDIVPPLISSFGPFVKTQVCQESAIQQQDAWCT